MTKILIRNNVLQGSLVSCWTRDNCCRIIPSHKETRYIFEVFLPFFTVGRLITNALFSPDFGSSAATECATNRALTTR